MNHPYLHIKETSNFGRGLYANRLIDKGTLIEISPLIVLSKHDVKIAKETILNEYWYLYDEKQCALALGYGSLFNHHHNPNISYKIDKKSNSILFTANTQIIKNQQLFIDYGYKPLSNS